MWPARKLIAFLLLLLFAPASTADALPLVWCLAPSGHNAIELFHNLPASSGLRQLAAKGSAVHGQSVDKHGACKDFIVSQSAQSPTKLSLKAPPSPDPVLLGPASKAAEPPAQAVASRFAVQKNLAANQLAQLRTVVLLI